MYRFFIVIILFLFCRCVEIEEYSEIPDISFKSITVTDTVDGLLNPAYRVDLKFDVVDGDGDIGLHTYDTAAPHDVNFFLKLYQIEDGIMNEVTMQTPLNGRIPYIQIDGQNTTLSAEIHRISYYTKPVPWDSVKFEFYIKDRALHSSNIDTSITVYFGE